MYQHDEHIWLDEYDLRDAGFSKLAGVDEAGRGCGAGEVVVACVMLPLNHGIPKIRDSKKVSKNQRQKLSDMIMERALSISIASATNYEIDRINIFAATTNCVYKAIANMKITPDFVFVDGKFNLPDLVLPHACVYGADGAQIYEEQEGKKVQVGHHYENVAAASLIAKVYRDNMMNTYDGMWPEYGMCRHKGYLTQEHRDAIKQHGLTPIHRKTFKGCKEYA